jgi:hypothetical protein
MLLSKIFIISDGFYKYFGRLDITGKNAAYIINTAKINLKQMTIGKRTH